ncbi:ABC transporter DrrB family efflux protein [Williamsia limnetica]|uniref:Transport permease protein n=1 Tax=Williamsia limnetica TaxID=882452 RepID=A0A318S145_WILLI|nr:ABC transporter permease [Williamsia limnetica]PYE20207.1 ABC transporter DrrB family efflux protein [Williamsia limnetica]
MADVVSVAEPIVGPRPRNASTFLVDCEVVALRNIRTILRNWQMILGVVLQPLMFVLLFSYVFGEALGGDRYREFLIGGIMTQTVAFNAGFTALGLATDIKSGMVDRFRALPMSRLAFVVGRSVSDITVNVVGLIVMSLAGLAIGWRIDTSFGEALTGYAIALLFGFALSWVGAVVGLVAGSAEAAQSLLLTVLFPLTFISSAFIPAATLPGPLRAVANWNPVTAVAQSLRECFGNPVTVNPLLPNSVTWASENPQLYSLVSICVLLVVTVPLASWALRRV